MSAKTLKRSDGANGSFDMTRFTEAQEPIYETALAELRAGRKRTHWMWFIFPQIADLGFSTMSQHYALRSLEEARAYLVHPVLGARLRECAKAVLAVEGRAASAIFGSPDDMKLQSSMTLFALAGGDGSVFSHVLEKYFAGQQDDATVQRVS